MLTRICAQCERAIEHFDPIPICNRCRMEPVYRVYAKQMLEVDELPDSLEEKLAIAESLVKRVKPHGSLSSTQTIASIIMLWELEVLLRKMALDDLIDGDSW